MKSLVCRLDIDEVSLLCDFEDEPSNRGYLDSLDHILNKFSFCKPTPSIHVHTVTLSISGLFWVSGIFLLCRHTSIPMVPTIEDNSVDRSIIEFIAIATEPGFDIGHIERYYHHYSNCYKIRYYQSKTVKKM